MASYPDLMSHYQHGWEPYTPNIYQHATQPYPYPVQARVFV
jgi:hypothetical protein